jgi:DNA-binding XRE family transcriptional regulator
MRGIDRAIEAAGGVVALAKAIGVAHQVITRWKKDGYVPAKRVATVAAMFNVPARDLMDPRLVELASDTAGE